MEDEQRSERPRPVVVRPEEGRSTAAGGGSVSVRTAIDRESTGCRNLEQRVVRCPPGSRHVVEHAGSEDVAYVVSGTGTATIGGAALPLRAGAGLLVPEGTACTIASTGQDDLVLLSVLAPQPGSATGPPAAEASAEPTFVVHASDQETIPAGDDERRGLMDRHFELLIDPARGARYVTQFVGFIERSRAPFHTHTYEEVVYIVGGHGSVHLADGEHAIGPGTSVYLPAGAEHRLENPGEEPLALVGVFCPAGSPAARRPASAPAG